MKKLLIIMLIAATIACQQKSTKDEPVTVTGVYTKEDSSLVNTAKMFFNVLPKEACIRGKRGDRC